MKLKLILTAAIAGITFLLLHAFPEKQNQDISGSRQSEFNEAVSFTSMES